MADQDDRAGVGTTVQAAKAAAAEIDKIGGRGVHFGLAKTDPEELADWSIDLWHEQDHFMRSNVREWLRNLFYCSGFQSLAWHKGERRWVKRKLVPWRIRSRYNVMDKAVRWWTSRLTENKPTVDVQAVTTDAEDLDRAHYKQTLFWTLWAKLSLHEKIRRTRRWSLKCGSGFFKGGWDPDAGPAMPVTRKEPIVEFDPENGAQEIVTGLRELYLDDEDEVIGPVVQTVQDDDGTEREVRNPLPPNAATFHEGEAFVDVRSPFNIRWSRYVDDLWESWYVQDADILPGSRILELFPDSIDTLEKADPATESEKRLIMQEGLSDPSIISTFGRASRKKHGNAGVGGGPVGSKLDEEFLVLETWIYPKNDRLKKLWGEHGAKITVIGGAFYKLVGLPEWAARVTNFVQLMVEPEEGNHYGKTPLRDLAPLQDDINRTLSHSAEGIASRARTLLGAPQNHQINLKLMSHYPAVLMTYRAGHEPKPIELGRMPPEIDRHYQRALEAGADVVSIHEASSGRLPSAQTPAKAVIQLQWADLQTMSDTSNQQDEALARLARVLDAITRVEYKETRKIRIVGRDKSYVLEEEIEPEHLDFEVDYIFAPGSMLATQKAAIQNEIFTLVQFGLMERDEAIRLLPAGVPTTLRGRDMQLDHARRMLRDVRRGKKATPMPWEDPAIHAAVFEEFLLSGRAELIPPAELKLVQQLWQGYVTLLQQRAQQQAAQQRPSGNGGAPGGGPRPPIGARPGPEQVSRAGDQLADIASAQVTAPEAALESPVAGGGPPR